MDAQVTLLGQRLKQLRELRGISLTALASEAGVAKSYLAKLERAQVGNPGLATLSNIVEHLGTTLPQLFAPATGSHKRHRWSGVVDPLEAEQIRANPPEGLAECLTEIEARNSSLPADTIVSLGRLQFGGKKPRRPQDWMFVYDAVMRSIR